MADAIPLTDSNFEDEIIKSHIPAMVDFWAEWCGPCKMIGPTIEALAKEYAGKVKVAKMDVDSNQITPGKFGIRNIPTIMFFKDGNVVNTIIGAQTKNTLETELKKLL